MPEQAVNADRVVALGLGRRIDDGAVTADVLRSAVDDVVSSSDIRTNLARMQAAVRAAGGVDAGVQAIEAHLA